MDKVHPYTCKEVKQENVVVAYHIIDPTGTFIAEVTQFLQVEKLLQHLNRYARSLAPMHHLDPY